MCDRAFENGSTRLRNIVFKRAGDDVTREVTVRIGMCAYDTFACEGCLCLTGVGSARSFHHSYRDDLDIYFLVCTESCVFEVFGACEQESSSSNAESG